MPDRRELLRAPWTPEQVHRLNRRQETPAAYTCPRHSRVALFATRFGWMCARACGFRQDWTYRSDVSV